MKGLGLCPACAGLRVHQLLSSIPGSFLPVWVPKTHIKKKYDVTFEKQNASL